MNKLTKKSLIAIGMAISVVAFNALSELASENKKSEADPKSKK